MVVVFLTPSSLYSQDENFIRGKLLDKKTGEPIVFATIRVKDKALGVISNKDGGFKVPLEFQYQGLEGLDLSIMYTPNIVKEFIWRPIQIALFNIESTTKINTKQINKIVDVITKWFGEKGVYIDFPRKEFKDE